MKLIIAVFGLGSFASMFLGTALGISFVGFEFGMRIFAASFLIFAFCSICEYLSDRIS